MTGRGTTPQAQTRTRGTRSASRDVSKSPAQTRRRGGRHTGTEAAENVAASTNTRGAKRGKKNTSASNLAPVEEDPSLGHVDPQLESSGDLSNVSGTTAVSSTSAQPGDTDKSFDDVCYALPHLYEAAEDLLEVLTPDDANVDKLSATIDALKATESHSSKAFKRCEGSFERQLENLTESQDINPTVFLRAVLKPRTIAERDASIWRPDDILYKANLANAAKRFATLEGGSPEAYEALRDLDLKFPSFFSSAIGKAEGQGPSGGSSLVDVTIDLALLIRTQLFIAQLLKQKDEDDFDPEQILGLVFYKDSELGDSEVRGWKFPLAGSDQSEHDIQQSTLRRITRLQTHLKDGDVDLDSLQAEFSWPAFQVAALEWVRERNYEINNALELRGGARSVVKEMKRYFQAPSARSSPAIKRALEMISPKRSTQPQKKPGNMSSLKLLKSFGKGLLGAGFQNQSNAGQTSTAPAGYEPHDADGELEDYATAQQLQAEDQDWHEPADGGAFEETTDPALLDASLPEWTRVALLGADLRDKRNQENLNRPRTFLDHQEGAQRISFSDGFTQASQSQHIASSALARSRGANGKRRAQDDEDDYDPSQDPGFQNDERDLDYDERRRLAPVPGGRAPVANMTGAGNRKRPRFATYQAPVDDYGNTVPYEAGDGPAVGVLQDNNEPPVSTGEQYRRAKSLAREATKAAAAKGLLARPTASQGNEGLGKGAGNPGKRKWSMDQEGKLIEYIEELGCKWSEIKKVDDNTEDNILSQWSQVDLKDKAINIRVDLLKSRTVEPNNFQFISLRQRDKDKLMAMGIDVPAPVARGS